LWSLRWNLQTDDLTGFGLRVCESLQLNSSSFIEMEDNGEQLAVNSSEVPSEVSSEERSASNETKRLQSA
ncbi:hypothetical protein KUCAC02_031384, partial [Chaenocephalus aceratus]